MKIRFLLLLIYGITSFARADTCPHIEGLDPYHPPSGWTLAMPPVIEGETYDFGLAVHSYNGSFYYKQVLCKYEACPSAFCPAFTLLSAKKYEFPNTNAPPWDAKSSLNFTFTCKPVNHDPTVCSFQ